MECEPSNEITQLLKPFDVFALDRALHALTRIDERQTCVVELRYSARLSLNKISEALEIVPPTGAARLDYGCESVASSGNLA